VEISIIIFCYNEAVTIGQLVKQCFEIAPQLSEAFEIIVVDDASEDATPAILEQLLKTNTGLKVITHPVNQGIGGALRTGYATATKEYVCAIPGDGQFDPHELLQIRPFGVNFFYSFYRPKTGYNMYRSFLTVSNKMFNLFFLGMRLKDVNWIKVYRKSQLDYVDIQMKSSIVESEICAKLIKSGCRPIELPSVYYERKGGEPKGGNWKTLRKLMMEMFSLAWVVYKFRASAEPELKND
jgi:glycosyltransferase involved in cell wall biosynthesis